MNASHTHAPKTEIARAGGLSSRAAFWILGVALAARLLVFASLIQHSALTWIFSRGLETGFVAHALLAGQGFASPFGGATGPTALISPGYTLLVAAVFRIWGDATVASAAVILLAQVALGVLTVWLVMCLAARLADSGPALAAGIFFAVWPTFLWTPTIFWDTTLTLCLLPALLLLALRLQARPSRALWLGMGALCGCAVLINLALSTVIVPIFCWAAWQSRTRVRDVALAAALALALYAPWPLRNARVFHAFIPLRTTVGLELWMGNRKGATGYLDDSIFPLYNISEMQMYRQLGEVRYMSTKSTLAGTYIRQHPDWFAAMTARRFLRFWFGTGTRGGSRFYAVSATLTTVLGLSGLVMLYRRRFLSTALLFTIPLLVFPLPYYITHAEFRYRLVLEPLLVSLAAVVFSATADRRPTQDPTAGLSGAADA